jgi:hypothetical protein
MGLLQKILPSNYAKITSEPKALIAKAKDVNPIVDMLNNISSSVVNVIIATAASTTTDFASLKVGDKVVVFDSTGATTPAFGVVVTAGTSPVLPGVGDLVQVIRSIN